MEKKLLNEAIKQVGLHAQARTLWLIHPLLEQMSTSFAEYVGMESLTDTGKPLLPFAMSDAFKKYKEAAGPDENLKAGVSAFVRSLLDKSGDLFSQQIVAQTDRGDIVWSPFVSGLTEFLAAYPGATVTASRIECKIAPSIATVLLMTKIIPNSLLDQESLNELLNDAKLEV